MYIKWYIKGNNQEKGIFDKVMKKRLLLFTTILSIVVSLFLPQLFPAIIPSTLSLTVSAIPSPTSDFYVNDYAGIIDEDGKNFIMTQSVELENQTGAQIVVLTIKSLEGAQLEDFSLEVLRTWGIGDKEKNNGLLILISVDDRKSRIEVGYGLEGALPDGKTGRIQDDYMVPYFSTGDYSTGIIEGYKAFLVEVYKEYGLDTENIDHIRPNPLSESDSDNTKGNPTIHILIILGLIILDLIFFKGRILRFLLRLFFFSGGRGGFSGGGGGSGGGFSGGGGSGGGGGSSRSW